MTSFVSLKKLVPKPVRRVVRSLVNKMPMKVEARLARPKWPGEEGRFSYQSRYVMFDIEPQDNVLDIGSGGCPFPHATILVDRFLEMTKHRSEDLVTGEKPLVLADISTLPFKDKSFDFVYCSHVLEHVEDPMKACSEIMRVGYRGFIETPTLSKDMMFAWADGMHKWHVIAIADILVFFEYSKRQMEGIRTSAWRDIIVDRFYHPLQGAFYENLDLFNTMLCWRDSFKVAVFRLDASLEIWGV